MISDRIEALLADKGYGAAAIREGTAGAEINAVIPQRATGVIRSRTTSQNTDGAIKLNDSSTGSRTSVATSDAFVHKH